MELAKGNKLPKISIQSLKDWMASGFQSFISKQGSSFASYSDLDSPINKWTFSAEGGKLGSLIHIKGLRFYAMSSEYRMILDRLASELAPFLSEPKHTLQFSFYFEPDDEKVKERLKSLFAKSYKAMKATQLDLEDIYDANIDKLAGNYTVITDLVLCVWTVPHGKVTTPNRLFPIESADSASGIYADSVLDSHTTLITKIPEILNVLKIDSNLMNINHALAHIRSNANPIYSNQWKPNIKINDKMVYAKTFDDYICQVPDRLNKQVTPGFCSIPNFDRLIISNRVIARSLDVERFGAEPREFDDLLDNISKAGIPARLNYTIIGGGFNHGKFVKHRTRGHMATPSDAYDSLQNLIEYRTKRKGTVVGIQMTASTWVEVKEGVDVAEKNPIRMENIGRLINRNYERLESCFTAWGGTEPNTKIDTPLYAWTRSIAGFASSSKAPVSFAPIFDAFRMLPLHKMSPIWNEYATRIFRTPKKEIIPFNRMASNQKYSFMVVLGAMRSGKSVFMGGMISSMAIFPGVTELPYISIIDVGRTSFGTLDLLEEGLPESKRHMVTKYVLQNNAKHSINPFHLPLGLRRPIQSKKDNLISFLKLLVCDENTGTTKGTEGYISSLINEVYKKFDDNVDNTMPKYYGEGVDRKLDKWLKEINYDFGGHRATYWELFDFFFEREEYKKAHLCQAYASPLLSDFIAVARSNEFMSQYKADEHLERVANEVIRSFNDALMLYPILSSVSLLNLDETKILALDLGDVATTGAGSRKKVAIMYSLALEVSTRNFFITYETLQEIPEKYKYYHTSKYNKSKSLPKQLSMDEFHRATGGDSKAEISTLVLKQVLDYVRVASKEQIEFILSTQLVQDITDELLELSTTQVILAVNGKAEDKVIDKFGLDQSFKPVLSSLGNPSERGSLMLIQNETNNGKYTHVVFNTVSAEEIWGQASYNIDVLLRNGLYKLLPRAVARKALALKFPGCTAKAAASQYVTGDLDDLTAEQEGDLVDRLIKEVYAVGKELMLKIA